MGLVARVGYPKVPLLTLPSRQDVKMAKVELKTVRTMCQRVVVISPRASWKVRA